MSLDSASIGLDDAVFISYTHVDNQPFGPDELRWVSHMHEQLASRVQQVFGAEVSVWRDEKLHGNDVFEETLVERLSNVAVLVSVCSPRYVRSEWCRRELDEFLLAAQVAGGVQVGTRSRVFKVMKTPVPVEDLPQPLVPVLGYEFYEKSAEERHVREFLFNPSVEERWKFYARVDDLAQDIAALLRDLVTHRNWTPEGTRAGRTVYLAEATSDVSSYRDEVSRELRGRGHRVLPEGSLPLAIEHLTSAVIDDLERSDLSVHLLGARYGARPEGEQRSIQHVQLDLAHARASSGLDQLIWTVRLWDPATGEPLGQPLGGHTASVRGVAFSPDGRLLASASRDGTVRLWDPATGEPVGQPLTGHTADVEWVAFDPDGTLLASASADRTVRLWDPATGEPIGQPLAAHTDWVSGVAFSPDGTLLASASADRTVRLWDSATGEPVGEPLTGHTAWVTAVAFSPDGRLLASASDDSTVRLWDSAAGEPVGEPLTGHDDEVVAVAFSPDGTVLASAGTARTVRLWERLWDVEAACELAAPYVKASQVEAYLEVGQTPAACDLP